MGISILTVSSAIVFFLVPGLHAIVYCSHNKGENGPLQGEPCDATKEFPCCVASTLQAVCIPRQQTPDDLSVGHWDLSFCSNGNYCVDQGAGVGRCQVGQ